jgi:hypothetical protein
LVQVLFLNFLVFVIPDQAGALPLLLLLLHVSSATCR